MDRRGEEGVGRIGRLHPILAVCALAVLLGYGTGSLTRAQEGDGGGDPIDDALQDADEKDRVPPVPPGREGGPAKRSESFALFSKELFPLFKEKRCLNCHSFNSEAAIARKDTAAAVEAEKKGESRPGRGHAVGTSSRSFADSGRDQMDCMTCHDVLKGEDKGRIWRAPPADLDFTGKGDAEICRQIKDRMAKRVMFKEPMDPDAADEKQRAKKGTDQKPLGLDEKMEHHMTEDPLIVWAFLHGNLPTPAPKVQPLSMERWLKWGIGRKDQSGKPKGDVYDWIAAGMACE